MLPNIEIIEIIERKMYEQIAKVFDEKKPYELYILSLYVFLYDVVS